MNVFFTTTCPHPDGELEHAVDGDRERLSARTRGRNGTRSLAVRSGPKNVRTRFGSGEHLGFACCVRARLLQHCTIIIIIIMSVFCFLLRSRVCRCVLLL